MKVTRRMLAKMAVPAVAAPLISSRQAAAQPPAIPPNSIVDGARTAYRSAAQAMATVKLPRTTEPAVRFEA
jgi:hypothetical protein